ncbi:MAG TPA: DUF2142 domain-containing protein, partial [Candidatus Saccharimonadales bacterium]|nr:DUF2142 domain-containing protein [Candidatus Saccharimonadales bacterium]
WLDTPLPPLINTLAYVMIGLAVYTAAQHTKLKVPNWLRASMVVGGLGVILATATLLYLLTMPVSSDYVNGLQGRYFIPAVVVLALAFCQGPSIITDKKYLALSRRYMIGSVVLLSIMTYIIFIRYYHAADIIKSLAVIRF